MALWGPLGAPEEKPGQQGGLCCLSALCAPEGNDSTHPSIRPPRRVGCPPAHPWHGQRAPLCQRPVGHRALCCSSVTWSSAGPGPGGSGLARPLPLGTGAGNSLFCCRSPARPRGSPRRRGSGAPAPPWQRSASPSSPSRSSRSAWATSGAGFSGRWRCSISARDTGTGGIPHGGHREWAGTR